MGWQCTTLDTDPKFSPSILADIMEWDYSDFGPVDVFWAGTPCTLFSNTSFKRDPTKGNILALKTLEIMEHFKTLNPKLIWFIENPWSSLLKNKKVSKICLSIRSIIVNMLLYRILVTKKRAIIWNNLHSFEGKLCPGPGKCVNMVGK